MQADGTRPQTTSRLRRAPRPAWLRWPSVLLAYGIGVPVTKLLERTGAWPRVLSRAMARAMTTPAGFVPSAHDVFVCSYFKTGTNWTMQIAVQIAHRGRGEFDHIHDLVPWLELPPNARYAVPLEERAAWQSPSTGLGVIKTHLPFERLPYDPAARYVCIVRDPKDVFVSSYHFVRATMLGPLMPSLERWLDLYLSPDAFIGSWAEHAASAWRNRTRENVLFMTYEEMKADLPRTVERIAALLGVQLSLDELERVVAQSSYAHMKSIGHKFDTVGLSPAWTAPGGAMVRRGERRTAHELLGPEEQRRIDDYWRTELARLGSDFPYDRAFA